MASYLLLKKRNQQHSVIPKVIGYYSKPMFSSVEKEEDEEEEEEEEEEEATICDEQSALGSLKYYDKDVDMNEVNTFNISRKIVDNLERCDTITIQPLEKWISKHKETAVVKKGKFFTNRFILTRVLNTLNDSGSLNLYVKFRDEKYYINTLIPANITDIKDSDALNFSLFKELPHEHALTIIDKDNHSFNAVYEMEVGGKSIIYSAEIPGVICDEVINTLEKLKVAQFVDTAVCGSSGGGECKDCAHYWTGAALISADRVLVAHPEQDKNVSTMKVQEITIDQLITIQNRNKNLNLPHSAWNLLDDLLRFIEKTMGNDPVVHKFKLQKGMITSKKDPPEW